MSEDGPIEPVVPPEVRDLLQERARIQGWLEELENLRDGATPAVYERIHADYGKRLEAVNARLTEHRAELEESLERHRSRVEALRTERQSEAEALEEAELRFKVGEYSESEWSRRQKEGRGAIERIETELAGEQQALDDLDGVLAELLGSRPPRAREPGTDPWEGDGVEAPEPAGVPAGEPGARAENGIGGGDGPPEASSPEAVAEAERGEEGGEEEDADADRDYLDELAFLESLSLEDTERFDAVSLMLDEEPDEEDGEDGEERDATNGPRSS